MLIICSWVAFALTYLIYQFNVWYLRSSDRTINRTQFILSIVTCLLFIISIFVTI